MSSRRDYYEILGIVRTASTEEIKKAYRQAALKYHPDRNPGDREAEENFKTASEAYEVLTHAEKRQIYDQYGHDGLNGANFQGFSNVNDIFSSFGDLFEDLFGMGGRQRSNRTGRSRGQRGEDLRYDLTIRFEEAYQGCEKEIQFLRESACQECHGLGHPAHVKPTNCQHCQGRGQVYHSQGFFTVASTCPHCRGQGQTVKTVCGSCRGQGRLAQEKKVKVTIPAGVDSGNQLVLRGEGNAGIEGGGAGDLYVVLNVKPHEIFQREGQDIWIDLPISFAQAALGGKQEILTLEGKTEIEIPRGTDAGESIILKGKGFANLKGGKRGDQIIQIILKTPKNLTPRQEELLREFAAEQGQALPPTSSSNHKKKKKGGWGIF